MLPSEHRLRRSADFGRAVRAGRRSGRSTVVAHVAVDTHSAAPATVGFVVSKAVGIAVVRNLVKRRLRAIVRELLDTLPPGSLVVLRALPPAAGAPYERLRRDVEGCLARALSQAVA